MNKQGNTYTFIYSIVLVVIVAVLLSIISLSLQPSQKENIENEKRQNILTSVNVKSTAENSAEMFKQYIKEEFIVNYKGDVIPGDAFAVDVPSNGKRLHVAIKSDKALSKAMKESQPLISSVKDTKDIENIQLPVFVAEIEGSKKYILPMYGAGLWGPVWGYIALNDDKNTVYGTIFDHSGETPGLGAEITQPFFTNQFKGKKVFENNTFKSITVKKGNASGAHEVDAISGGTITSQGVEAMLDYYFKLYEEFLKK